MAFWAVFRVKNQAFEENFGFLRAAVKSENEKPLQVVCKGFVFRLQSGCRLSFSCGVFGVVGGVEGIVRVGGELNHRKICDVYEVFAVMVTII